MWVEDQEGTTVRVAHRPAEQIKASVRERAMQDSICITNARVVTPGGVLERSSVRVEDGRIAAIGAGSLRGTREIDARGGYLLPGFIDIHSDAIEKGIEPRPNTFFPVDIAVFELDKKIAACGITTMFHSLSFAELEVGLRNNNTAAGIIRAINGFTDRLRVNTRIHARYEITDQAAAPILEDLIRAGQVHLLSFMDHSPGQGQFRDILAFKRYYGPVYAKTDAEMDAIIARKQRSRDEAAPACIDRLAELCRELGVAMASHDDDSPTKIGWLKDMAIGLTEFPVNMETIHAARACGIRVCLGSPNVVRGRSQSSNLSAREAIGQGCGDILCSDYSPMTLLHAVFILVRLGLRPMHEAIRMVSLNPARAVGLAERTGSIDIGKDADLVLADCAEGLPRVLKTFVRGREVFATC